MAARHLAKDRAAWYRALEENIAFARAGRGKRRGRLQKAPFARDMAEIIGKAVNRYGPESPIMFRAIGALVTQVHPVAIAYLLTGRPPARRSRRRRQGRLKVLDGGRA